MSREVIYQVPQNRKDGCINHYYWSLEEAYAKGFKSILKAKRRINHEI